MKKRSTKYKEMVKSHKEKIMSAAKQASIYPFDYAFGLNMFVEYLRFMKDYYELGENVYGEDNTKLTRLESLTYVLKLYDEWATFSNKYEVETEQPSAIGNWFVCETTTKCRLGLVEFNKEYKGARDRFFKAVSKYIEEWWD